MRFRTVNLMALSALALPLASPAETLSYRYADLAHFPEVSIDAPGGDVDGDGVQLRGSLPVYENIFALAEFQDLNLDAGVDVTRLMVGAGIHWPMSNMLDLIARVGIVQQEVSVRSADDDDDTGVFAGARLRAIVAPKIELEGGIEHQRVEAGGLDNDTYIIAEGRYNFTPQWSAGVLLTVGGDTNVLGAQGRFTF
jgi:hypothetical protein